MKKKIKKQKVDIDVSFFEREMNLERLFEEESDMERFLSIVVEAMVKYGISEIRVIGNKEYESH